LNITLTNVVSISYKNKASLDDFIKMYQKKSPKIYPNVEKSLLNLLHNSGYPGVKFEKGVDFESLYNQRSN